MLSMNIDGPDIVLIKNTRMKKVDNLLITPHRLIEGKLILNN